QDRPDATAISSIPDQNWCFRGSSSSCASHRSRGEGRRLENTAPWLRSPPRADQARASGDEPHLARRIVRQATGLALRQRRHSKAAPPAPSNLPTVASPVIF